MELSEIFEACGYREYARGWIKFGTMIIYAKMHGQGWVFDVLLYGKHYQYATLPPAFSRNDLARVTENAKNAMFELRNPQREAQPGEQLGLF